MGAAAAACCNRPMRSVLLVAPSQYLETRKPLCSTPRFTQQMRAVVEGFSG